MSYLGRPTIDLNNLKSVIYYYYCEQDYTLQAVIHILAERYMTEVNLRSLKRRLAEWGFHKNIARISSTLLPTLQARLIQLFHHHMLTDREILVVLQQEGYPNIIPIRLQHLRLSIGLSRRAISGNYITNQEEIQSILEAELNTGTIIQFGRQRVYEHLRRQGYLIARYNIITFMYTETNSF